MTSHGGGLKCLHCEAATNGVVLCKRCRTTLTIALQNVGSYHADLFSLGATIRVTGRRSGTSDPTGASVNAFRGEPPVERAAAEATTILVAWVRALLDDRPGLTCPADSVAATSEFLRANIPSIVTLEWAGEFMRQMLELEGSLHGIVSRGQGATWSAGICGARTGAEVDDWCPHDLVVKPGQRYVRCGACGHSWPVGERRKRIIEEAREKLLPVSTIAKVAVTLLDGEPSVQRLEARLNKWVERGQLEDYGVRVLTHGQQPRRVYRLGDVMDKLARAAGEAH